jgi:hypothetical protein
MVLLAASLVGCEIDPADQPGARTPSPMPTPPGTTRPVSDVCNVSPLLGAGISAQIGGAFCVGVALTNSDLLRCAPAAVAANVVECIDEAGGFAYFVRWAGQSGTIFDASGQLALGGVRTLASGRFEITAGSAQSAALPAGVCTLGVEAGASYAQFCPYTN